MANVTIRNIPDKLHHALKVRPTEPGYGTEAGIRKSVAKAPSAQQEARMGFIELAAEFRERTGGISRNAFPASSLDIFALPV